MKIVSVSCSNCGAPINVPEEVDQLNCVYCGASLRVQRAEGYVALKMAEKVSQSIQEGSQITQMELKRLQISQEISNLQLRLSAIQAEIRSLERQKKTHQINKQLKDLEMEERQILANIKTLQMSLTPFQSSSKASIDAESSPQKAPAVTSSSDSAPKDKPPKDWVVASWLALFLGWIGVHRFYTGHLLIGLIQLFTFGGFMIWWLIDLFMLASGKYKDAHGQMLENYNPWMAKCIKISLGTGIFFFFFSAFTGLSPDSSALLMLFSGALSFVILYFGGGLLKNFLPGKNAAGNDIKPKDRISTGKR